jgi:hypothetical protein
MRELDVVDKAPGTDQEPFIFAAQDGTKTRR